MLNVGTFKTLSYLASFGLLGGIGYSIYDHYNNGQNKVYIDKDRIGEVLMGTTKPEPPTSNGLNYTNDIKPAIVEFDWTGAPPPPPPVEKGPEEEVIAAPTVTPVDEILDVVAIFAASDDPADCRCLVRFAEPPTPGESDVWLYIGDSLPSPNDNISVLDIEPQDVTFSFADNEREAESIRPHDRAESSLIAKADKDGVITRRGPSLVSGGKVPTQSAAPKKTERKNGQFYIGTEDAEYFSTNYNDILARDISSSTHYEDGKRAGIKIESVKADSIAAQHGMQQGDIIKSINGYPVNSKQEAISFAKKNSDRYKIWQIEVENMGRVRTEVYHSPEK